MSWISKTLDGETVIAELGNARVEVFVRSGNVFFYKGCIPGDHIFARLVKAARQHCAE
jgi:uncharacterized protein (DUF1697 family)